MGLITSNPDPNVESLVAPANVPSTGTFVNTNTPPIPVTITPVVGTVATPVNNDPGTPIAPPGTPTAQASSGVTGNNFIEDITDQQIIDNSLPIGFKYGNTNVAQESGVTIADGQYHRDQSITGAILSQVQSSVTGNLLQITLEIRGDPYWLGQTNLDRALTLRSGDPTYSATSAPDWASGKELIFIHFRYPLTVGDDFVPVLRQSQSFNGLYMVYHVKHTFADGAFKQIIQAVRQPLIQNDLASTSTTADTATTAPPPVTGQSSNPGVTTPQTVGAPTINTNTPPGTSTPTPPAPPVPNPPPTPADAVQNQGIPIGGDSINNLIPSI